MSRLLLRTPFVALSLCAAATLLFAGSGCRKETLEKPRGELLVQWTDVTGAQVLSREATYDFGAAFVGRDAPMAMVVKNHGAGTLTLISLDVEAGADRVHVVDAPGTSSGFEIVFPKGQALSAGEALEIPMVFRPAEGMTDVEATLVLHAENTAEDAGDATIHLTARAISGQCDLPDALDFGTVEVGGSAERTIEIQNPTELPVTAYVAQPVGSDAAAFPFAPGSDLGEQDIPPGEARTVTFRFAPTQARSYLAVAHARASAECPERLIQLKGAAVDQVLSWAPASVDFGYVPTSANQTKTITFTNVGNADVTVSEVKTSRPAEFEPGETSFTVPGHGGTHELPVGFHSSTFGLRVAQLTFTTSLQRQPKGAVPMTAFGGGPRIKVLPTALAFGKVPWFASNPNLFQTRRVDVLNVGTSKPDDPAGSLHLGQVQPDGTQVEPYFEITPTNADTAADEFTVSLAPAPAYDPALGLPPTVGKNSTSIEVKLTPKSAGAKAALLTIYSNDFAQPAVTVPISADAVVLPPCVYQVTPTHLSFGIVGPTEHRELGFEIKNLGSAPGDVCLVSALEVAPGSDPAFTLPAGPVAEREIGPGESFFVEARAWPQTVPPAGNAVSVTGSIGFFISSDTQPAGTVTMEAMLGRSCLLVAPDTLDFGTVKVGCRSATRTVNVYNACNAPVTVTGINAILPAGQPAGGTHCPGTTACPEFVITAAPAIPTSGLVIPVGGAPLTFQARYTPIDYGADPGVIGITTVESTQNLLHTVPLKGVGDTVGIQTDTFVQSSIPQSDILLVIDGSCSMATKQQSLANNMQAFFTYANSGGVDYHIAVIDGQGPGSNPGPVGEFRAGTLDPDRILTPTSANVENQFQAKVTGIGAQGADEQCFDPALLALTAPLSTTTNTGFLRQDASLAIICVTDDQDYSPNSATYYLAALENIKGASFKSLFSLSAIAVFQQNCGIADDGSYANMVQWTGGVKEEICTTDWAASLKNISQVAFGARGTFYLTAPVDQTSGPPEVKIDGMALPPVLQNGQTVWSYDPATNAVTFDPLYRPEPGQTLTVSYDVICY